MDLELQELQQTCGSLGLRAPQDLLAPLAHQGLREFMESKDHRVSLETTGYRGNRVCLERSRTPPDFCLKIRLAETMMRAVKGAVPKGCQGCQAWLVPREKRETRASLV